MELQGKYGMAKVYTDVVEETAVSQIEELLNQSFSEGTNLRIMPDVHAGKGCVIGTTMRVQDKICPNLVGVDIGCGVLVAMTHLPLERVNLELVDKVIRKNVPSGFNVRKKAVFSAEQNAMWTSLRCHGSLKNKERILASLGTLGGGNHFIEVNKDYNDRAILVIHSGSRNLGVQVAKHYQDIAIQERKDTSALQKETIQRLREAGRQAEIPEAIAKIKELHPYVPDHLAYLEGQSKEDYLHDMLIVQEWAERNRALMADIILTKAFARELTDTDWFQTIHNYIDNEKILRKGAVSAKEGEMLIIPLNMRDGSLICVGKGNEDWNWSAPHGAGRIMSRGQAKRELNMLDFFTEMQGIFSSSISFDTLDEAPMAYKSMIDIMNNSIDTVRVLERIVPIYNFKASGD